MRKKETFDFFIDRNTKDADYDRPLAARMRPRKLTEFVGQKHILASGRLLRRCIEADRLSSIILYGPPGTGKTSLAFCISSQTQAHFEQINAVTSNINQLRKITESAKLRKRNSGRRTILFIDELHHFNKQQQDVLNPFVEDETVILIGVTVENPFFSLNSPLLSRSHIFSLNPLTEEELREIINKALKDKQRGLGKLDIVLDEPACSFLCKVADGDARRCLNAIEIAALTTEQDKSGCIRLTLSVIEESIQKKAVVYDRDGDNHYDTISAFIKSMRGSDPDATLYWLAKMIYAGEDARFIARRICICAAEDVGNAQPQALVLANAARDILEYIGMPEARIALAQAAVFIACSPKSNASYMGIENALQDVKSGRTLEVPAHLRDSSYPGAEKLGHGKDYKYAHDYDKHYVKQKYIPKKKRYYIPTSMGYEAKIKKWLEELRAHDNQ
ncbi:MAG: replication-associated recombination protein A [Candidatus Omnitrophica bacterium]|nr:replication-associated recombination protein A [Candidatus Omnitrophota bacterium]